MSSAWVDRFAGGARRPRGSARERREAEAFFADLIGRSGRRAQEPEARPDAVEDVPQPVIPDFLINRHLAVKRSVVSLTSPTGTGNLRQGTFNAPNGDIILIRLELQFRKARVDFLEFIASILENKGWNVAAAYQR